METGHIHLLTLTLCFPSQMVFWATQEDRDSSEHKRCLRLQQPHAQIGHAGLRSQSPLKPLGSVSPPSPLPGDTTLTDTWGLQAPASTGCKAAAPWHGVIRTHTETHGTAPAAAAARRGVELGLQQPLLMHCHSFTEPVEACCSTNPSFVHLR